MSKVIVVGAGIGGQLISKSLKNCYGDKLDITLIGKVDNRPRPGLFYFDHKIPKICDKEVVVSYEMIGDGDLKSYQIKSRGYYSSEMKNSSFNNIGKSITGYLMSDEFNLNGIKRITQDVDKVLHDDNLVVVNNKSYRYDFLIMTTPLNVTIHLMYGDVFNDKLGTLAYKPVYQKITGFKDIPDSEIDSMKVFYDLSDSNFYRHTSYYNQEDIVKMISESITKFDGANVVAYPGKIIPNEFATDFVGRVEELYPQVKLLGRYARWDYHYLISNSVDDAISFIEKVNK